MKPNIKKLFRTGAPSTGTWLGLLALAVSGLQLFFTAPILTQDAVRIDQRLHALAADVAAGLWSGAQ